MAVSVETVNAIERRLSVEISWDEFNKKQQSEYQELQKKARIDGFRPGKAPMNILKQHYSDSVRYETMTHLMRESFANIVKEKDFDIVGMPTFEPKDINSGEPFHYTAIFEVYPEFDLITLTGQKISRYVSEITDTDIKKSIDKLRKDHGKWVDSNQPAADGDRVEIDFFGKMNGEPFEGGKAEHYPLELGQNRMIAGFEQGIVGAKVGESRQLNLSFPNNYHVKDLAGKPVSFDITVHKVEKRELAELNDALFKKLGIKEMSLEALEKETRSNMQRELSIALENRNKKQVFDTLSGLNDVLVPKALIEADIDHKIKEFQHQYARYGVNNLPNLPRDLFREEAKKSAKLTLLLQKLVKQNKLEADQEQIDALIKEQASIYDNPDEMVHMFSQNDQYLSNFRGLALEKKIVDLLLADANVHDDFISYFELLGHE